MSSDSGFQPSTLSETETPSGPAPRSAAPVRLIVITLTIAVVLVPIAATESPREAARWTLAAAAVAQEKGDFAKAMQLMDKAISLDPGSDDLMRIRGNWRVEAGDAEQGLADLDKAVQLSPERPLNYVDRSTALQALGRFADAVRDWDRIVELNKNADDLAFWRYLNGSQYRFSVYNARAYARGLAGIELQEALEDINRAIDASGSRGNNAGYLDTRGFILFKMGKYEEALTDMDPAVQMAEQDLIQWPQVARILRHTEQLDERGLEQAGEDRKRNVAVIRYHRGLLHQAMGQEEAAAADFDRVQKLGFEANDELF